MNGYVCKGLIVTQAVLEEAMNTGDDTKMDPENLVLDTDADWETIKAANPENNYEAKTEEDAVANCRAWYDWKNHDQKFCCQMSITTTGDNKSGDF